MRAALLLLALGELLVPALSAPARRSEPRYRPSPRFEPVRSYGFNRQAEFHRLHVDLLSPTPEFDIAALRKRQDEGAGHDEPSSANSTELLAAEQAVYDYFVRVYAYLDPEVDAYVYDAHIDAKGLSFVYIVQLVNGIVITNREASATVYNGTVISSAGNLLTQAQTEAAKRLSTAPRNSPADAAKAVMAQQYAEANETFPSNVGLQVDSEFDAGDNATYYYVTGVGELGYTEPIWAELEFWAFENGTLDLSWYLDVEDDYGTWTGYVVSASTTNATTPRIHAVVSYETNAASSVYLSFPPNGTFDPLTVPPARYTEGAVANAVASPQGWTGDAVPVTSGNNVRVMWTPEGLLEPAVDNVASDFVVPYSVQSPVSPESVNSSLSMLFFYTNYIHDMTYIYGFDEASGNFQESNFGRTAFGEKDRINALAQFGSLACPLRFKERGGCMNNANFATPPDGKKPVMRYYLFDVSGTVRDSTIDREVIAHEIMHGISNRLTGGRRDGACLETQVSGGMGEGWGDVLGLLTGFTAASTPADDRLMGAFLLGGRSIRSYPYSTSGAKNPLHYGSLNNPEIADKVHAIGTVWASMLFEVYWQMMGQTNSFGDLMDPKATGSNNAFMLYLITGLKLQPCNPTFVQARDAFLLADATVGNKLYLCSIWRGFAKRGLGVNATGTEEPNWLHIPSWDVPAGCTGVAEADKVGAATFVRPGGAGVAKPTDNSVPNICGSADCGNLGSRTTATVTRPTTVATGTGAATSSRPSAGEKTIARPWLALAAAAFSLAVL